MPTGPSSSETPYIEGLEPNVTLTSILTTGDSAPDPDVGDSYVMAGIPDGLGAYDNGDGTITVLMNHELPNTLGVVRDHGSVGAFVSELVIDKATLQVVSGDDLAKTVFLWNTVTESYDQQTTAFNRLCSSDLPEEGAFFNADSGLGTNARIYMTGEETGPPFSAIYGRGFAFIATGENKGQVWELPEMGDFAWENSVANPDSGDATVVVGMDDATPGQIYVYVGEKQSTGTDIEKAGLTNGALYGVKVAELRLEDATSVTPLGADEVSTFSLVDMSTDDPTTIADETLNVSDDNGFGLEANSDSKGITEFFRPEDGQFDPTNPNHYWFVTTATFTAPSRLYRMEFTDVSNPTAGGTIRLMFEGPASGTPTDIAGPKMMDNMTVADDGKVYVQEDPGANSRSARIYVYDPATDTMTALAEHDVDRFGNTTTLPTPPFNNNEESSGIIDVTDLLGDGDTQAFLMDVQAHYLTGNPETVEGGQLLLMTVDTPSNGTSGDDEVNGGFTDDDLRGKAGDDDMEGGSGADTLKGNQGDDTITGGSGVDRVKGGGGADVFVFAALTDSATVVGERDVLVGFRQSAGDLIDLSRIDADATTAGDQAFTFITGEFSGAGGEVRVVASNGRYLVEVDVGTDGLADMAIAVLSDAAPDASAFVL